MAESDKEQQTEMCTWQSGHRQIPRDGKIQHVRKAAAGKSKAESENRQSVISTEAGRPEENPPREW